MIKTHKPILGTFLSAIVLSSSLISCGPRGESKSLEEVFKKALTEYNSYKDKGEILPSNVAKSLNSAMGLLQKVAKAKSISDAGPVAKEIAKILQSLVPSAGYTTRPAMTEIIEQYNSVGLASDELKIGKKSSVGSDLNMDSVRLLVARTFFLLASELKAVRFQLLDREKKS